jgi:hypothetical protein
MSSSKKKRTYSTWNIFKFCLFFVGHFAFFDPGSGSRPQKSVQIHGICIYDTDCNHRFQMALFKLFFSYLLLSHSHFVLHSPPGDQLWNVESLSALFISLWSKKSSPPPLFYHVILLPEAWQEKLEHTATNCPVQWRGTREGERSTFPSILHRFSP